MNQGNRTSRFLIEAFVIVSSILLAFGIDAWWDARQERVEEAEVLAGLQREFSGYRAALSRSIERHGEMMSAMAAVLASIEAGAWTSTDWQLDEAVGQLLSPPTSDLGNGVRDALVQAGRLELISDAVLRERLAQWPGFYEEVLDDEVFSRQLVLNHLVPYFTRQGQALSSVLFSGTIVTDSTAEQVWPARVGRIDRDPVAARRLLSDPEFKALVEVRYSYWHHAGGEYRAALRAAEEILSLLDRAL